MAEFKANLESLCKLARKLGATNAVSLDAHKVVVDERVRLKCSVPVCDDYGVNLMCPPNVMSVNEFRGIAAKYKQAILIQIETPIPAEMRKETKKADNVANLYRSDLFLKSYRKHFDPVKLKLHHIVCKIEAKAFELGYRFAVGFIGGSCKLCPSCVTVNSGRPCRHPFQARPSMEAMGIDAFQTAANAGLPFDMPPKGKAVWNGLVLID
jgi:predicted metal-binding protein